MNKRTAQTVTISLPPEMVEELDRVRRREHRTRSDVLREALRRYVSSTGRRVPVMAARPDEIEAIRRAEEEFARGETVRLEDLQHELGLPTR